MNEHQGWQSRVLSGLVVVVLVCAGVRVASELVAPLLPVLLAIAVLAAIFSLIFRGPHYKK